MTTDEVPEQWRPVVGWEEVYEVSDLGRLRRLKAASGTQAGRILIGVVRKRGYPAVVLFDRGRRQARTVHSLVAEAFLGPRPPKWEVNHIDHDRTNPRLANLEYVTRQQNHDHARRAGRLRGPLSPKKGEQCKHAKLTEDDVLQIRAEYAAGAGLTELGTRYQVTKQAIHWIVKRKNWKHI